MDVLGVGFNSVTFFGPALTISLLLQIATLAFISCFTFLNVILSFLQALTIPLLLLVATLSSANTGVFLPIINKWTSLYEEITESSLFAGTKIMVGLRQAQKCRS